MEPVLHATTDNIPPIYFAPARRDNVISVAIPIAFQ